MPILLHNTNGMLLYIWATVVVTQLLHFCPQNVACGEKGNQKELFHSTRLALRYTSEVSFAEPGRFSTVSN